MSNDTSARDSGDRRMEKPAVDSKGGAMTIEEFESGLIQLGFKQSSRNRAAYQKKDCPRFRFVIRKRVVRLEEKDPDKGKVWHLNSSYLISRHLHLALWAADNCGLKLATEQKRRSVKSFGEFVFFFGLGALSTGIGIFLSQILTSGGETGPSGLEISMTICTTGLFLAGGLVVFALMLRWWLDRRKFMRSFLVATAHVTGRRHERESDDEGPGYISSFYLTVGFSPSGLETSGQRVEIKAKVSEEIYRSFLTGSPITVKYAGEDPRIAILEGE